MNLVLLVIISDRMQNVKTKLWSGAIVIQQDNLPGLSQGDEISVDVFHEEASKLNRVNFDWASSNTACL